MGGRGRGVGVLVELPVRREVVGGGRPCGTTSEKRSSREWASLWNLVREDKGVRTMSLRNWKKLNTGRKQEPK